MPTIRRSQTIDNYSRSEGDRRNGSEKSELDALFNRPVPADPTVVLVDEHDHEIGTLGKLAAHEDGGTMHRAFSIFVVDSEGRLLLQRRAKAKYHFGGLWTNACCGHAIPGEDLALTAAIRLWQEMRLTVTLREVGAFTYQTTDPVGGLTEQEFDHVFVAECDDDPSPDPSEAEAWRRVTLGELQKWLREHPDEFTPWFAPALEIARC